MAGEDAGGGDPVFMDRLNVNCGTGKVLSQFKYERDGDSKQRYSVKCVEPEVADALMCSAPRTTGWVNRNGIGEWQAGFEYVAPWCGANEVMQQFKLLAKTEGNNKMAYQYTCCKVKGDVGTIAAYNVLKKVFQHLLNKQNKELAAASGQNDALKKAYDDANKAYLDAASSLSVAETNAKTAKEALEYATQEFEKFQSVVASAQKEVDETIPKLTAEKNELNDEKPILSQLRTMIDGLVPGPAATKALTAITQLASSIFTPKPAHKAIGKQVKALQMSLASETTTGFDNVNTASLLAIIDSILDGMNTRIGEIDRAIARINGELTAANVKKLADQTALVGLAEKKDKSTAQEASMRTEVSRLDGVKTAAKEAYDNYNPGYLTQKASSDKIIDILKIIMAKIDEAIAKCATPK